MGVVPSSADSVVIPAGTPFAPLLSMADTVGQLYLATGASLQLTAPLHVLGTVQALGTISGSGALTLSGSSRQNLRLATVSNLRIHNAAGVRLLGPASLSGVLTLSQGEFDLNNQRFTLISSASGTAALAPVSPSASLTNASQFTVQRYLSPTLTGSLTGAWTFVGPSVQGQTVASWSGNNPYAAQTYNLSTPANSSVWLYNPFSTAFPANAGWVKPSSPSQAIAPGQGARVWFRKTEFFQRGAATFSHTGSPIVGNYSVPSLQFCANNCAVWGGSPINNGWNLVANPYPAPVVWDSVLNRSTGIAASMAVFRNEVGSYAYYANGISTNGASNRLASGQGILIQTLFAGASLNFTENCKTLTSSSIQRLGRNEEVRLSLQSQSGKSDETVITWGLGRKGFDVQLDARKLPNTGLGIGVWEGGEELAIEQRSARQTAQNDTVGLSLQTDSSQVYTLHLQNSTSAQAYLWHRPTGLVQAWGDGQSLPLALSAGTNRDYAVIFSQQMTALQDMGEAKWSLHVYPNPSQGILTVATLGAEGQGHLHVRDVLGRVVHEQKLILGSPHALELKLPAGVYYLQVGGPQGLQQQSLTIQK